MSENTENKHPTHFKKGQSGNPKGRPKGARNKATIAVEALLDGQAKALTQKAVEQALSGDMTALRLCLERICPPRKDRPIQVDLPKMQKATDCVAVISSIFDAVGAGEITPEEAQKLSAIVEVLRKVFETQELEARIEMLEQGKGQNYAIASTNKKT